MATVINFLVDQGTKFEGIAEIQNEDGTPFNLTDYVPYGQFKRSYYTNTAYDINVSIVGDPQNGEVKLVLLPTTTSGIRPGRYVYDVEVHNPNDPTDIKRILQGILTLDPEVTKSP
jgi:hypothetical protein